MSAAAYHPTAAELDQIRRDPTCVACDQPAVAVWVWEHDMRADDLFPLCSEHLIGLIEDLAPDAPRFIHLSDLMGEPQ